MSLSYVEIPLVLGMDPSSRGLTLAEGDLLRILSRLIVVVERNVKAVWATRLGIPFIRHVTRILSLVIEAQSMGLDNSGISMQTC